MKKYTACLLLGCLMALLLAACQPGLTDLEAYPMPPATQALATLLARGVATGEANEYPAPFEELLALTPPSTATEQANPDSAGQTTPTPAEPAALLASRHYLAGRLVLMVRQVRLLSWEEAAWITPNLGCQPTGVFYPQSPILGYRITLRANDQTYELHSDQGGETICLAEALQPGERVPLAKDLKAEQAAEIARQHLASRTGWLLEAIAIESIEASEWEDASLGCAMPPGNQPDRANIRPIPGYRILLSAPEGQPEYHSGGFWLVYCGGG